MPEDEANRVLAFLRDLPRDPVKRSLLLAPLDDEPATEADLASMAQAEAEFARGEYVTSEELRRELGL